VRLVRASLLLLVLLTVIASAACVALRLIADPQQPVADALEAAVTDIWAAAETTSRVTMDAAGMFTAAACDTFSGASGVSSAAVEVCAALPDHMEVRSCLTGLVQRAAFGATA